MSYLSPPNQENCQSIYLHYNLEKFWEVRVYNNSNKATIRCGKLEAGEEELLTVQSVEKVYNSPLEASKAAKKLAETKLAKGYQHFKSNKSLSPNPSGPMSPMSNSSKNSFIGKYEDLSLKRKPQELAGEELKKQIKADKLDLLDIIEMEIEPEPKAVENKKSQNDERISCKIPCLNFMDKPSLKEKADDLGVKCTFEAGNMCLEGKQSQIQTFKIYVSQLSEKKQSETEVSSLIKIPIPSNLMSKISAIEKKGTELGLICKIAKNQILVMGSEGEIKSLKRFIEDLEEENKSKDKSKPGPSKQDNKKEEEDPNEFIQKEILLPPSLKPQKTTIDKKLEELGLFYEYNNDKLYVLGPRKMIASMSSYLEGLDPTKKKEESKPDTSAKKQDDGQELMMRKEIDMDGISENCLEKIKNKGDEVGFIVTNLRGKLAMLGLRSQMDDFLAYIEEAKKSDSKKEVVIASKSTASDGDNYVQKELSLSTFHRARKDQLKSKAEALGLISDFGYDVMLVAGPQSSIHQFIAVLYEVEAEAKKSLYPKYWDFHETRPFSKVNIAPGTEEYKMVEQKFLASLNTSFQVIKVERIQNKYLMEHFVTNMQKKMEGRVGEACKRKLLFHGTRTTAPEVIYKSFDTGFDTQYAAHGSCGTGLYFAENASYSCSGYEYHTKNKTCQLFLADVFVGKSSTKLGDGGKKAPPGMDSVFCQEFYVIYNNFHSYPLYLIEYKAGDRYAGGFGGGYYDDEEEDEDYDEEYDEDY